VVESSFSAVRLRTDAARRYKKVANAEALIWKILTIAEKKFPRFNSPELLEQVNNGQLFEDGIEVEEMSPKRRTLHLYHFSYFAVEGAAHHQRTGANQRGVPAPHQNRFPARRRCCAAARLPCAGSSAGKT